MTAAELAETWAERDRRYATRRYGGVMIALSDDEVRSIKCWRHREADDLPSDERSLALVLLQRWMSPYAAG